ncbi:MAG TPA: ABC transporter permease, partial [Oleiagrimonas sp.]|nr:ABC transporter permease [Oleiagrimonas sp.]
MNVMFNPAMATNDGMSMRRTAKAYVEEMRSECLRYARNPGFIVPVLIFSCMFYLLFVVVLTPPGSDAG